MLDPVKFRTAMSRLGAAVNIITTDGAAGRHGMTASAVCSVTDDPPTILFCVNRTSRANRVLKQNGVLCVNILAAGQEELSRCFSDRSLDQDARFASSDQWFLPANGVPALSSALAALACKVETVTEVGSHSVFFATVEQVVLGHGGEGLVYFDRAYHPLKGVSHAA